MRRKIAVWASLLILCIAGGMFTRTACRHWRWKDVWTLDPNSRKVTHVKVERWLGFPAEVDEWDIATGLRRRQFRLSTESLEVQNTVWSKDGSIEYQDFSRGPGSSYGPQVQVTMRTPPWRGGVKDRQMDAPWLDIGFEEWRKTVVFTER